LGLVLACADSALSPGLIEESAQTARLIRFQALEASDTVLVIYHHRGCFSEVHASLAILPAANGASLILKEGRANTAPGWHLQAKEALTVADLAGLDELLAFYRHVERRQLCTSEVTVTLTLRRAGEELRRESYFDDTCQATDRAGIVTVGSLLEIVESLADRAI